MTEKENKSKAAGIQACPEKGTENLGYWEFRKQFCKNEGWQLRRVAPQTYDVLNDQREKIGIFKSGEGYYPSPKDS